MIPLTAFEEIIDASGIPPRIEAMLPIGVRPRQLKVRTLLAGMCLAQADGRPAHLTRVHQALTSLPEDDQIRLGVLADWKHGPHRLTYRQAEYTFGLVAGALGKDEPDGLSSGPLQGICDDLLEASVPGGFKDAGASLAVDWTGLESFSRPPPRGTSDCADPEASWGHRKNNLLRSENELFFGYYSPPPSWRGRRRPARPRVRPPRRAVVVPPRPRTRPCPRADRHAGPRDPAGRHPGRLRVRPPRRRRLGDPAAPGRAQLMQDLHPHDRGPKGTHDGAIIANGSLYCPATPRALLELAPLGPGATGEQAAAHDAKTAEASRHKLGRITADDEDGYHRVQCPAAMGKIRCPLRPASMTLDRDRPEVLTPPENPQACCTQQTITVPADVNAKTRQKHDYPPAAHRRSYARRTGAERGFATVKDPAASDITRGWCRLMGLAPLMLFTTTLLIVRNQRILTAWNARQAENTRRAAAGLPPKTRKRRRKTLTALAAATRPP